MHKISPFLIALLFVVPKAILSEDRPLTTEEIKLQEKVKNDIEEANYYAKNVGPVDPRAQILEPEIEIPLRGAIWSGTGLSAALLTQGFEQAFMIATQHWSLSSLAFITLAPIPVMMLEAMDQVSRIRGLRRLHRHVKKLRASLGDNATEKWLRYVRDPYYSGELQDAIYHKKFPSLSRECGKLFQAFYLPRDKKEGVLAATGIAVGSYLGTEFNRLATDSKPKEEK